MRLFPLLATSVFLSGCATHFQLPVNHLSSAETLGRTGLAEVEALGTHSGVSVSLVPSYQQTPPDLESPEVSSFFTSYFFGTMLGISEKWEVGFRYQINAPLTLRGKYQIYGRPKSQIQQGDWAISALGSFGFTLGSEVQQDGSSISSFEGRVFHFGGGLIGGYRLQKNWEVYLVGSYSRNQLSVSIEQKRGEIQESYQVSASEAHFAFGPGTQIELEQVFLRLEGNYYLASFESLSFSSVAFGASAGFHF